MGARSSRENRTGWSVSVGMALPNHRRRIRGATETKRRFPDPNADRCAAGEAKGFAKGPPCLCVSVAPLLLLESAHRHPTNDVPAEQEEDHEDRRRADDGCREREAVFVGVAALEEGDTDREREALDRFEEHEWAEEIVPRTD